METHAPAVVALVVASQPDQHLVEMLASLRSQDYATLQTLVLLGPEDHVGARLVAEAAPGFLVTHLDEDRGFGAAINRALEQVTGAAFFLLCHDDVILEPDVVHLMVEESFRSNAAVVTPKMVTAADPSVLLHVGQGADRLGTVVERVLPGEIDQGQHDAVRDVFVAPGGVTLIRADLLRTLGGFDERYVAMGDDLELSWRARLAGARLVCAPQAVVHHAQRLAGGARVLPDTLSGGGGLGRLRRRNELRLLLTCWRLPERVLALFLLGIQNLAEIVVAAVGGDHERAVDIRESWRVAFRERRENRAVRKRIEASRTVSDRTVRSFQSKGSTRLRTFLSTFFHHGYDAARGMLPPGEPLEDADEGSEFVGFGAAFSEDEGFDEFAEQARRAHRPAGQARLSSARALFVIVLGALALFLIGSRNLLFSHLPMIGQLVPLGSFVSIWHHVLASWQPAGLGSGAPSHPAYGVLGLASVPALGRGGIVIHLVLIGAVPLGALGVYRLLRPVASNRARVLALITFGGISLGVNDIALGSLSGLVALAATPFLLRRLLRLARVGPFDEPFPPSVPFATRGWRRSSAGQVVMLGLLLALSGAVAPALFVVVLASSLAVGLVASLQRRGRPLAGQGRVLGAVLVAAILLAPFLVTAGLSGTGSLSIFGVASGPWSNPGLGGLLRFAVGPNGGGVAAWAIPAASLVAVLIARAERLTLAAAMAAVGLASLGLALFASRGGWGTFAPDLLVLLAPLATAMAVLVGLGLAALEQDLASTTFGWRQLTGSLCVVAALVGLLPVLGSIGGGRWKLPTTGYGEALSFLGPTTAHDERILWLGDPRSIPGASWPIEPGLAWSLSTGGLPDESNLFAPPTATAAGAVTNAVREALAGSTVRLGQLLAPAGVRAIVVTTGVGPSIVGGQTAFSTPPPATLLPALESQGDLTQIPGGAGTAVFESSLALPILAARSTDLAASATASDPSSITGWTSLDGATLREGTVPAGDNRLFVGLAPAGDFAVSPSSGSTSAFGWASTSAVRPGPVQVSLHALPLDGLANLAMVLAWLAVGLALLGRHRWLDWWWPASRRARHAKHPEREGAIEPTAPSLSDGTP